MKYRAKITSIKLWVKANYNTTANKIIKDGKDAYIEVDKKKEADLLEAMNKAAQRYYVLNEKWVATYGGY